MNAGMRAAPDSISSRHQAGEAPFKRLRATRAAGSVHFCSVMKILSHTSPSFDAQLRRLDRRHVPSTELQEYVAGILAEIRDGGDKALLACAEKFDGAK